MKRKCSVASTSPHPHKLLNAGRTLARAPWNFRFLGDESERSSLLCLGIGKLVPFDTLVSRNPKKNWSWNCGWVLVFPPEYMKHLAKFVHETKLNGQQIKYKQLIQVMQRKLLHLVVFWLQRPLLQKSCIELVGAMPVTLSKDCGITNSFQRFTVISESVDSIRRDGKQQEWYDSSS